MGDQERDSGQLWGELREVAKGVAVLQTEVQAIHRRLDEIGGHIQTREMCDEKSHTVGVRLTDHEDRIKTLETARQATPARVLWMIGSAVVSSGLGALIMLAAVGKV